MIQIPQKYFANRTKPFHLKSVTFTDTQTATTMIIQKETLPHGQEILQDLQNQFSDYAVYEFGANSQKSIIVRQSALVGAQVMVRDGEVMVDACFPNVFISGIMSLFTASTLFPFDAWTHFERKVGDFFRNHYA